MFEIAAGTNTITTIASFATSDTTGGLEPTGNLVVDAAGNLYGTTAYGGPNNGGTVFEIAAGTNTITTLASFDSTAGLTTGGLVLDAAGNLYGTTSNSSTVFKIAAGTHTLTTVASLGYSTGSGLEGNLIVDAAGNLYGTAIETYGSPDSGTVYEVAAGTGVVTVLLSFTDEVGGTPQAGLLADAAGNLYGTTSDGGANDSGSVFELSNTGFQLPVSTPPSVVLQARPPRRTPKQPRSAPSRPALAATP